MSRETVLILANGEWNDPHPLRNAAKTAGFTIAADGAWAKAQRLALHVDLVVGDLDSLTTTERDALAASETPVEAYPADKDWTDLELAITHALTRQPSRILIFGAFGGRIDHALAAVFLLDMGVSAGVPIILLNGSETLCLVSAPHRVEGACPGDRVSLLPITDTVRIRTHGLRFPLHDELLLRGSSRGISNEVIAPQVQIDVVGGKVLVLHARQTEETGT